MECQNNTLSVLVFTPAKMERISLPALVRLLGILVSLTSALYSLLSRDASSRLAVQYLWGNRIETDSCHINSTIHNNQLQLRYSCVYIKMTSHRHYGGSL
jgi:hypothetical protein